MRRAASIWIFGACFAVLLAVAAMTWPQIDPTTGLWIMGCASAVGVTALFVAVWPVAARPTLVPDLPVRSLFFHIDQDVLEDADGPHWIRVGRDILSMLSTGQLHAWGEQAAGGAHPLTPIPQEFWANAEFTFNFFEKGERHEELIHVQSDGPKPAAGYRNIRFNEVEVLGIWPLKRRWWRFPRMSVRKPI